MNPRRSIALLALVAAILLNRAAPLSAEPIHGEIRRAVTNPWGLGSLIGWGLATDGNYLYASSYQDGLIRVIDIPTLAILSTFQTEAEGIHELDYRDGLLHGVSSQGAGNSRFFTVSPTGQNFDWTFTAPSDGFTSLSFGPDGLLYAADGFQGQGADGTRVYAFDANGNIVRTIRSRLVGPPDELFEEIIGTSLLEWLPGNQLLIDFTVGSSNLNLPTIENEVLIPGPTFQVPGFTKLDPRRGSAVLGDTPFLWGFTGGSVRQFYEIQIVPEPSSGTLAAIGLFSAAAAFPARRRRR